MLFTGYYAPTPRVTVDHDFHRTRLSNVGNQFSMYRGFQQTDSARTGPTRPLNHHRPPLVIRSGSAVESHARAVLLLTTSSVASSTLGLSIVSLRTRRCTVRTASRPMSANG